MTSQKLLDGILWDCEQKEIVKEDFLETLVDTAAMVIEDSLAVKIIMYTTIT